jgi:GTPase SAR1 family protein
MGGTQSNLSPEEKQTHELAVQKERIIGSQMNKDKVQDQRTFKLLLLGTGESGKSTLFKQMLTIYGKPPTQEELNHYHGHIQHNLFIGMYQLCKHSDKWGDVEVGNQTAWEFFRQATAIGQSLPTSTFELEPLHAQYIAQLWSDPIIQTAWDNRAEFQIGDSVEYFMQKVDKIAESTYNVTQDDYVRLRIRTTGIVENEFKIEGNLYKIFDVGGQRNERKKWIHCFENVSVVIFVVAMSEYDQKLAEDEKTNRMEEALVLFEEICNSVWFKKTSMLLFLNKRDLFETKLQKVPLNQYFESYTGPNTYDHAQKWLQEQFVSKSHDKSQAIYSYCTTAVDSNNVRVVLNSVRDTILRGALQSIGVV